MSAGAVPRRAVLDPNEDAGAVVRGSRADLLVVADGHRGAAASEVAVEQILEALGADPPPADLTGESLTALFFDAGIAVQRETTRAASRQPDSRTTLALALVTDETVQWASLGDSCVAYVTKDGASRLDVPRSAYLGYGLSVGDIAATTTHGLVARETFDCLVLTTDGLVDALSAEGLEVEDVVHEEFMRADDATQLADRLLRRAIEARVADAVTVAVASTTSA
jgi:serine/threonine protein phosphatase PrpC